MCKVRTHEQWVLRALPTPTHVRLALWNLSSVGVIKMQVPRGACFGGSALGATTEGACVCESVGAELSCGVEFLCRVVKEGQPCQILAELEVRSLRK